MKSRFLTNVTPDYQRKILLAEREVRILLATFFEIGRLYKRFLRRESIEKFTSFPRAFYKKINNV